VQRSPSSWPGLSRPSTCCWCLDAADKRAYDEVNVILNEHRQLATAEWAVIVVGWRGAATTCNNRDLIRVRFVPRSIRRSSEGQQGEIGADRSSRLPYLPQGAHDGHLSAKISQGFYSHAP
jgi:hypothetical protein